MNLSQFKAENYKIFSRQAPENKAKNINALQYIEGLAARSKVNISHWNIAELFKDSALRGRHIVSDVGKINQIFFEQYDKFKSDTGAEILEIENTLRDPINKIFKNAQKARIEDLNGRIRERRERASRFQSDAQKMIRDAWTSQMELAKLVGEDSGIGSDIIEILRTGFWNFHEFDGVSLCLTTVTDMILSKVNPAANINLRVNFGKFLVKLNIASMHLTVHRFENNIGFKESNSISECIHPHVSFQNEVCWGNASESINEYFASGNIKMVMETLAAILSNLGGTPYISLETFSKIRPIDSPANPASLALRTEVFLEEDDDELIEVDEEEGEDFL